MKPGRRPEVSHVRTPQHFPREIMARVLRQVRLALHMGHADRAIAAIRDNLCGHAVEPENVGEVPLAETSLEIRLVNLLEEGGIVTVDDVLEASDAVIQVKCRNVGATSLTKIRRAVNGYVERMSSTRGSERNERVEISRSVRTSGTASPAGRGGTLATNGRRRRA